LLANIDESRHGRTTPSSARGVFHLRDSCKEEAT
jgi:hypothetical protein